MPFLEIEKNNSGEFEVRYLAPGLNSQGCFNGEDVEVGVTESGLLERTKEGITYVLKQTKGTFVYDGDENAMRGILFLHGTEALRFIMVEKRLGTSHQKKQDMYKSLWRRLEIDTGNREAKKWTLERVRDWFKSSGRTELFSDV